MAVDCPGDLRPYLHGVPTELAAHSELLAALGVRRRFSPEDFARASSALAKDAGGAALTEEKVELATALAEAASEALAPPPNVDTHDGAVDGGGSTYPSVPDAARVANTVAGQFALRTTSASWRRRPSW